MKTFHSFFVIACLLSPVFLLGQVVSIDEQANQIIQEILVTMREEKSSITIKGQSSTGTQFAKATKDANGARIILFNRDFLSDFNRGGVFRQRAYFILAHEVAHHLNNDEFDTDNKSLRRQMEIKADSFAGKLLYYLCIDPKGVAQVLKNLPPDPSGLYLPINQRMEVVRRGYEQGKSDWERVRKDPCDGEKMDPPMALQLKYKKTNKAEGVTARIFHDSILIRYNVYPLTNSTRFEGWLAISNKARVAPNVNNFKWLDSPATFGTEKEAVWYYKKDGFSYKEVFNGDNFGLAIFKHGKTPKPAKNWRWWVGGTLFAGGVAMIVTGTINRIKAQQDYNQYKNIIKPSVYTSITGITRQQAYANFNPQKKSSETCIGIGAIPFGFGLYFLLDNNKKRKNFHKDIFLIEGSGY